MSDDTQPDSIGPEEQPLSSRGMTPSEGKRGSGSKPSNGWEPPTPQELEHQIPQYRVLDLVGRGGMGAVYKGLQVSLERHVAIKILPPEIDDDDAQFANRFKREARTMAKLRHPGIVSVYDAGETDSGLLYIVMEFIEGTDVARMVKSEGRLTADYALAITAHVCDALQYAHSHGVMHRDIKPANIMLNMEGAVKVADFGLAKATEHAQGGGLTRSNVALGTPDYIAPEALVTGIDVDQRADLYAIGVMLYNMLTGQVPRGAFRPASQRAGSDPRFDAIIMKAMEPERESRYQSAQEIRRDLDAILTAPRAKESQQGSPPARKPVARGPGKETDASVPKGGGTPAGKERSGAGRPSATSAGGALTSSKSAVAMVTGIAGAFAAVGIVAFFIFKKPDAAPDRAPPGEEQAPVRAPVSDAGKPPTTNAITSTPGAAGEEKWVDAIAQWFGGTKTHGNVALEKSGAARIGSGFTTMEPLPASAPPFRDHVARVRSRPRDDNSEIRLIVRRSRDASGKTSDYNARLELKDKRVRLGCYIPGKPFQALSDYKLPPDFDYKATHALELRVVGDLLTVTMDGQKLGERRDAQLTMGHPAIAGRNAIIASFEYAVLDPEGKSPTATTLQARPVTLPAAPASTTTDLKAELRPAKTGSSPGAVMPSSAGNTSAVSANAETRPPAAPAAQPPALPVSAMPAAPTDPKSSVPPPQSIDPRLVQLEAGFKARYEADAKEPFDTAVAALNQSYVVNGIARARSAAQAKGSLPEVTALDAEKTAIEEARGVPDEDDAITPDSLKALRGSYRSALAKLTSERDAKAAPLFDLYTKALDDYTAELTKANKIEEAKQVQALRVLIAARKEGRASASGDSAPKPASGAESPAAVPRLGERRVAEWVIATGGGVTVSDGGPDLSVNDVTQLPRGRFTLKQMTVKCDKVPDKDLSPVASARDVWRLHLQNNLPDKTFLNLAPLRKMPKLTDLMCPDMDDAGVDVVASLSGLTRVALGKLPDGSLAKLAALKDLENFESPGILGPGIAALKPFKKLRRIQIRGTPCAVTDADVRAIVATLPDLESLQVGDYRNPAPITNDCVASLLALKRLKTLSLNGKDIDDGALEIVIKLGQLESLGFQGSKVTGNGFGALAKLKALKELYLNKSAVTDAGLDELAKLKALKLVNLTETSASDPAVAKLKKALPACNVVH